MKITHVIAGLSTGGAQMMLYKLLAHLDRAAFEAEVVSLADVGPLDKKIRALGVPVRILGMRPGVPNPSGIWKLARWLRQDPPHVIQTWMYHADLIGSLAAALAGRIPVAWNIRHSNLNVEDNKRSTFWTVRACAGLSRWLPARIVCCSESSRDIHAGLGYAANEMVVIPNGFDLDLFRLDPAARLSVRQELGVGPETPLIGLVGRFNPQKDHRTFVQAAARLRSDLPEVHFLLCGEGVTADNPRLGEWISTAGIGDRCHLMGHREDMPRLTAALDIATTASAYGEGFPNVIGEAMACGVPCVATDVGDSAQIVDDTGRIVPPRDPSALAEAWRALIMLGPQERVRLGLTARRRIERNFSLPSVVARYRLLYEELASGSGAFYKRAPSAGPKAAGRAAR
jgi:glycosyltransferase involved in cell wall biosynthesis